MAEQAWFPPDGTNGSFAAPPPPPPPTARAGYELRPLTTGEILDRTFYLYRSNFWLFAGLAAIASAVNTATALAQILYLHFVVAGPAVVTAPTMPGATGAFFKTFGIFAFSMVAAILYLAVYSVTQAATTSAVTHIYLGDATSMRQALNEVKGRWFRFILIGLWQIWSSMWVFAVVIPVVGGVAGVVAVVARGNNILAALVAVFLIVAILAGAVYGVIAFIRNSFAVPAAVMEGLKVRDAMRRSKNLTLGTKGRIFLLYLFVMALYFVAVAIQSPISIIILQKKTTQLLLLQALGLFVSFFSGSVIGPVGAIGLCLFYIDQRIRKEGFDIEFLIDRSGPFPAPAPDFDLFPVPPAPSPVEVDPVITAPAAVDPVAVDPVIAAAPAENP